MSFFVLSPFLFAKLAIPTDIRWKNLILEGHKMGNQRKRKLLTILCRGKELYVGRNSAVFYFDTIVSCVQWALTSLSLAASACVAANLLMRFERR